MENRIIAHKLSAGTSRERIDTLFFSLALWEVKRKAITTKSSIYVVNQSFLDGNGKIMLNHSPTCEFG